MDCYRMLTDDKMAENLASEVIQASTDFDGKERAPMRLVRGDHDAAPFPPADHAGGRGVRSSRTAGAAMSTAIPPTKQIWTGR
jgi:hypothetical protein